MSAAPKLSSVIEIKLEVLSQGPLQGQSFTFQQEKIKIGRGPENDMSLPGDLKMSREHAIVEVSGKAVYLRALNEKNPVWVDGEWVQQKQLPPGAQVKLGDTEIRFIFKGGVSSAVLVPDPIPFDAQRLAALNAKSSVAIPLTQARQMRTSLSPQNPTLTNVPESPHQASAVSSRASSRQAHAGRPRAQVQQSSSGNRLVFYIIVAGVIGGAIWLMDQSEKSSPRGLGLRDKVVSESAIQGSEQEIENLEKEVSKSGRDTVQFRLAEEQFHRGFRDYLNGQYSRAMEQFQAALSFFPEHRQSRRYFHLARRKFDQQIQSYMRQGQRYYGVQNYRLCAAFYSKVVTMIRDQNNPQRREALQFVRECQAKIQAGGL